MTTALQRPQNHISTSIAISHSLQPLFCVAIKRYAEKRVGIATSSRMRCKHHALIDWRARMLGCTHEVNLIGVIIGAESFLLLKGSVLYWTNTAILKLIRTFNVALGKLHGYLLKSQTNLTQFLMTYLRVLIESTDSWLLFRIIRLDFTLHH